MPWPDLKQKVKSWFMNGVAGRPGLTLSFSSRSLFIEGRANSQRAVALLPSEKAAIEQDIEGKTDVSVAEVLQVFKDGDQVRKSFLARPYPTLNPTPPPVQA